MAALDPSFLAQVEGVFADAWVLVGTRHDLPEAERWFVYEAYATSLLVCRAADERLRAFVNSCTHRGTRLCREPGQGRIQCPYHGWVFGTDGRLLGATKRAGLAACDDEALRLTAWDVDEVNGLIFVRPSGAPAQPLADQLGPDHDRLRALDLSRPPRVSAASIEQPWEEVLAEAPGRRVGPNLLVEDLPPVRLTTVVPLGPGRAERREYDWGS